MSKKLRDMTDEEISNLTEEEYDRIAQEEMDSMPVMTFDEAVAWAKAQQDGRQES